jgi:hypothetical protein
VKRGSSRPYSLEALLYAALPASGATAFTTIQFRAMLVIGTVVKAVHS